jgi:hypothetical protein
MTKIKILPRTSTAANTTSRVSLMADRYADCEPQPKKQTSGKTPRLAPAPTAHTLSNVSVHVGTGAQALIFSVPRDSLCAASEDFRTSIVKDEDGLTSRLNLPRCQPATFSIFLGFLQGGTHWRGLVRRIGREQDFDCAVCQRDGVKDWDENTLVDLWLFASRHTVTSFEAELIYTFSVYYSFSSTLPPAEIMGSREDEILDQA